MKNQNKEFTIILICAMLFDLFLLFLDWLDLKCFLPRGPMTLDVIRQFFSYSGPMTELMIAVILVVVLAVVLWKGRNKKEYRRNAEAHTNRDGFCYRMQGENVT